MKKPSTGNLWFIFLTTLFIQFVGGIIYFVLVTDTGIVRTVYAATKFLMVVAPILLFFGGFTLPKPTLKPQTIKSILYGVTTGIGIAGLIFLIYALFQSHLLVFADDIAAKVHDFGIMPYYFLAALGVSLVHSLFEEYFWRWYVVRGLEVKLSPTRAIVLGGALFALHHYIVLSQFVSPGLTILFGTFVGVGGVIWSFIYKRTDSLLGPWISHAIVDGALFYVGYLLLLSTAH